jgi:putative DNA primase/helicase
VVLPESRHKSGVPYRWINLDVIPPSQLPADIAKMILDRPAASSNGMSGDLADTATILQGVPEGERDDTLFRWACRLRRQVGDDGRRIVELAVLDAAANCVPPFPPDQALRKVDQAWAQDHSDSFIDWQIGTPQPDQPDQPNIHPLTDLGNAYRFYDAFGKDVLYVEGWGWVVWTAIGWERDSRGVASGLTHQLSNLIMTEARSLEQQGTDIKTITQHTTWARRSQAAATMHNALAVAKDISMMRHSVDEFDASDDEICARNGMIDLRTGDLRSIGKDDLVTKNTWVHYDPDFQLPEWNRFLWDSCGGDLDLIRYLQLAAGYSLTGRNSEEKLFLISGPPASGKSTFLDAVSCALGGYATTTSPDTFMWSRNGQQPTLELARMAGMRLVAMSEIMEGSGFNANLIKGVTGGEKVTGKFLYENSFTYLPKFKLWIGTNHDPMAHDDALWRRIAKISFPHSLPPERRDPRVKAMLRDPDLGGKAVLAWAVRGAMEWYQTGLMQPYSVTAATFEYHSDQDQFQQFLNECVRWADGASTPLQTAYSAYRIWCEHAGFYAKNRQGFARMMRERGYKTIIETGQEFFVNTVVTSTVSNMYQ